MRFSYQSDNYSCGVHSLRNAAAFIGIEISFEEAKQITGAKSYLDSAQRNLITTDLIKYPKKTFRKFVDDVGTSEKQIKRGLKKLGLSFNEFHSDDPYKFLKFLDKQSGPVIMLFNFTLKVTDSGHWIVCSSKKKDKYQIIDSAPWSGSTRQLYLESKLLKRFIWYNEEGKGYSEFYAIAVRKN